MPTQALNKDNPETKPFDFRGDCCICAKGKGSIRILREANGKFEILTDVKGSEMEFGSTTADGIAFNGTISCGVRMKYKVQATGDMLVSIHTEK